MGYFNTISNIIGIFFMGMFVFALALGFSITDSIQEKNIDLLNETLGLGNEPLLQTFFASYTSLKTLILNIVNFIIIMLILLSMYSSFMAKNDLASYLFNFIGGMIVGSLCLYILTSFYNYFGIVGVGILDLTLLPNFFFNNLALIISVNIIAGLLSFFFGKKGEGV